MSLKTGFVIKSTTGETYRLLADNFTSAISKVKREHDIDEADIKNIESTSKISTFGL